MSGIVIDAATARKRYSFMFSKISLSRYLLNQWFDVPEFVEGLVQLDAQRQEIDNVSVLELMKRVYDQKTAVKSSLSREEYGFRNARHSINSLSRIVNH